MMQNVITYFHVSERSENTAMIQLSYFIIVDLLVRFRDGHRLAVSDA